MELVMGFFGLEAVASSYNQDSISLPFEQFLILLIEHGMNHF
jgi:hypothetical protein